MKYTAEIKSLARYSATALCSFLLLQSFHLMYPDRSDCPEVLDINFVYTYNIHRADMLKDHVGGLKLFIFDEKGYFVTERSEHNSAANQPLSVYGYTMHVDGLKPGKYQFIALAMQKHYDEALSTDGAKYRHYAIQPGDSMSKLKTTLDFDDWAETSYSASAKQLAGYQVSNSSPLDTLWHGMLLQPVELKLEEPAYATISLMRNTKRLNVSIRQLKQTAQQPCSIDDYDVYVADNNATTLYNNDVEGNEQLLYTPHTTWDTKDLSASRSDDGSDVTAQTAHAELNLNRLMTSTAGNAAKLHIYNNKTGTLAAEVNLPDLLQQGRAAYDMYSYSTQEYLDREHNYSLSFYLVGDSWEYVNLTVSTLPWAKRIYRTKL